MPQSLGGLNYGRGTVAIDLTIAIIVWVGYLTVSKVDVEREDGSTHRSPIREPTAESAT